MKNLTLFWIAVSILFETIGDYFAKVMTMQHTFFNVSSMFIFYNLMLIAWYFAMKQSGELAITGTVWLLSGQLAVVILGVFYFKEQINSYQIAGLILALIAMLLLTVENNDSNLRHN